MLKHVVVGKENYELAIKIQNDIFPDEDGSQNIIEFINGDSGRKEALHWIHFDGDQIVGISGLYSYYNYPDDAWLAWFGVCEKFRNKGYGEMIFNHFKEQALFRGYSHIRLYTDLVDNSRAQKFYEKLGMTSEIYSNPAEIEEINNNTLIYSKNLRGNSPTLWGNKFLELSAQINKQNQKNSC